MNAVGPAAPRDQIAAALRAQIQSQGPIGLEDFMAASNAAYYAVGDVFGVDGDFITAPEISQCFGELIGLWAAVTWRALGAPKPFNLVECGPGRGTLMADMLRACARVPEFLSAADIHLVEQSPALVRRQQEALHPHSVRWHGNVADVPAGPAIIVANEFLDALPIRQWQRADGGWSERRVGLDHNGAFQFVANPVVPRDLPPAAAGTIFEELPAIETAVHDLARRIARDTGAALLIDYGYGAPAFGDTLQAVRRHAFTDVLATPGQCDLTAHVNFAAVAAAARGVTVFGPVEQGTWLQRLGIATRAERLAAGKTAEVRDAIFAGVERLTDCRAMGSLFKVMALTSLQALEGFTETGTLGAT